MTLSRYKGLKDAEGEEYDLTCSDAITANATEVTAYKADSELVTLCTSYWGTLAKKQLFTYILVTFVFLQVFNFINCRKIDKNEQCEPLHAPNNP